MKSKTAKDEVKKVNYAHVTVKDSPGVGVKLLGELKKAKINMVAFSGFPIGKGQSQIDMVTSDITNLKKVALKNKWKLSPVKQAFLVTGPDRLGAVSSTLEKLNKAKINVTAVDAASAGAGRYAMILWVKQSAVAKAATVLSAK